MIAVLVIVAAAGYGGGVRWLGISERTATLWDWLHLLLLPIAALSFSLWLTHRPQVGDTARAVAAAAGGAFAVLIVCGYAVPWRWTGFTGNSLWDWLNLVALPLAVAAVPALLERGAPWEARHRVAGGLLAGVLLIAVLGGYLDGWGWTGFAGNTVWDWLHLLLLPLLLPTVIVPTVNSRMPPVGERPEPDTGGEHPRAQPTERSPLIEPVASQDGLGGVADPHG